MPVRDERLGLRLQPILDPTKEKENEALKAVKNYYLLSLPTMPDRELQRLAHDIGQWLSRVQVSPPPLPPFTPPPPSHLLTTYYLLLMPLNVIPSTATTGKAAPSGDEPPQDHGAGQYPQQVRLYRRVDNGKKHRSG